MLLNLDFKRPLRMYVVWFPMYVGDARERWNPSLLSDSRAVHYWDEQRIVGRMYLQQAARIWPKRAADTVPPQDEAVWDAYFLYGPNARWGNRLPDVTSWGAPILKTRETLEQRLTRLLKRN